MYCDPNPFTFLRANSDGRDNIQKSRDNTRRGIETMNNLKGTSKNSPFSGVVDLESG